MSDVLSLSSRFREALGSGSGAWRGAGPLCIRALRARLDRHTGQESNTADTFDDRFGVNTRGITALDTLQINSPDARAGARYEPTDPSAFRQMMEYVPAELVARATFVDVGCGRGRVLILAAQHGFTNVVGIDFAEELCQAARSNIARFISTTHNPARFSVEQVDACAYQFPPEPMVIFLYNPFNQAVMNRLVAALEASLKNAPRAVYVMYSNPFWRKPWELSTMFTRMMCTSIWAQHWYAVYRHG